MKYVYCFGQHFTYYLRQKAKKGWEERRYDEGEKYPKEEKPINKKELN